MLILTTHETIQEHDSANTTMLFITNNSNMNVDCQYSPLDEGNILSTESKQSQC